MEVGNNLKPVIKKQYKLPINLPKGINEMCKKWDKIILPDDLTISTITVICKLDVKFDLIKILSKIDLKEGVIEYIRGMEVFKSLGTIKKHKIVTKSFRNQLSIGVFIKKKTGLKLLSIKLFINGSLHITGCKELSDAVRAMNVLMTEINDDEYRINKINELKVVMINSGFKIGFNIDRDKLYKLVRDTYTCSYDPTIHACVDMKIMDGDKIISVFIFESGSIIITGGNSLEQIVNTYQIVNKILLENYKKIVKNEPLSNSMIAMFLS